MSAQDGAQVAQDQCERCGGVGRCSPWEVCCPQCRGTGRKIDPKRDITEFLLIHLTKDAADRLARVALFYNKSSAQILIDLFEREDAYGQSSAARRRG
jgi:hypothetical protein